MLTKHELDRSGNVPLRPEPRSYEIWGKLFLVLVLALIGYAVWAYQLKPYFAAQIPEHDPLPLDQPPVELTSIEVRAGGSTLTPTLVTASGDSVYVATAESAQLFLYNGGLQPESRLKLSAAPELTPTALVVSDSFIVAANYKSAGFVVSERDGYHRATISYYPDSTQIHVQELSVDRGVLTLCDAFTGRVALISLIDHPPFYSFLELVREYPEGPTPISASLCALMLPDSTLWVGSQGVVSVVDTEGRVLRRLKGSRHTPLRHPVDMAIQNEASSNAMQRIHLLDRDNGKVLVYSPAGELTLVYPQARDLSKPTSIAINPSRRQIYIAESGSKQLTVFGY